MNAAIINHLNVIRALEQQKLLYGFQHHLKNARGSGKITLPYDLVKNLTILNEKFYPDNNYSTAANNYRKLRSLLLLLSRKNRSIRQNLAAAENKTEIANATDPALTHGSLVNSIAPDIEELDRKIQSSIPENLDIKPLGPFIFMDVERKLLDKYVSIIVVTDNDANHLNNFLESFLQFNTFKNVKIIIADQHSTDNTTEIARKYHDKLPLEIIRPGEKTTYAYISNLAADKSGTEYLLFLDVKTVLDGDIIPELTGLFHNTAGCGIIGASIHGDNHGHEGAASFRGGIKFKIDEVEGCPDIPFPLYDPSFLTKCGIKTSLRDYRGSDRVFIPPGVKFYCVRPFPERHSARKGFEEVPGITGSLLFCKRSDFIKSGGFNLNYFNGYEALDLCLQFANRLDKKTYLAHDVAIRLRDENIDAGFNPADEIIGNYNLGIFLNNHGYYLKYNYLESIIGNKQYWTDDIRDNIMDWENLLVKLGLATDTEIKGENKEQIKEKILNDYLKGIREKKLRIAIKIPPFDDDRARFWGDYHFAHSLKNAFKRKGYPARVDLYDYWYRRGYLVDDVVIVLRGIKDYHTRGSQINIMWNISHPEHLNPDEYLDYDHVFVASRVFADELREQFNINAEALLQCTDSQLFFPEKNEIDEKNKTGILVVANSRGVMRRSVDFLMKKKIRATIFGTSWEKLLPEGMVAGEFINNEDLRKYYSGCKILVNDHWDDMAESGYISNRIFDALACGTVILTDKVRGIEEIFKEGLFYYENADDMEEKIYWITENYNKARSLAMNNAAGILKNHTFDNRAERILEVIREIHERKTTFEPVSDMKKHNLLYRLLNIHGKK